MILVLLFDRDGRLVDTACSRRYHASIKSRQTSPTGDERQNKRKSGPSPADSLNESQLAARSGPSPPRRTSPTKRIQTASLNATAATAGLLSAGVRSEGVVKPAAVGGSPPLPDIDRDGSAADRSRLSESAPNSRWVTRDRVC